MTLTPCLLDEHPGQLDGLAAVIGEIAYEPIPTSDPEEALRLVKRGRCRLLLADLHMPGMRRYLYRYLKRDAENTKIKAKSGGAAA